MHADAFFRRSFRIVRLGSRTRRNLPSRPQPVDDRPRNKRFGFEFGPGEPDLTNSFFSPYAYIYIYIVTRAKRDYVGFETVRSPVRRSAFVIPPGSTRRSGPIEAELIVAFLEISRNDTPRPRAFAAGLIKKLRLLTRVIRRFFKTFSFSRVSRIEIRPIEKIVRNCRVRWMERSIERSKRTERIKIYRSISSFQYLYYSLRFWCNVDTSNSMRELYSFVKSFPSRRNAGE